MALLVDPAPWRDRLSASIALSSDLEVRLSSGILTPLHAVAFGSVTRLRRLSEAIAQLDVAYSYEARVLSRSMLEIYYNYAWIRLQRPQQRARRFLKYADVDRVRIAEDWPADVWGDDYGEALKSLKRARSKLRHLFYLRDSKGVLRWAKSWAEVPSIDARIVQVQHAESTSTDRFMYAIYRAFSGTAHGSPHSFDEAITAGPARRRARTNQELAALDSLQSSGIVLLSALSRACVDAKLPTTQLGRVQSLYDEYATSLSAKAVTDTA